MTRKSRLLFVLSAAALAFGASPAFAGAGGAAAAQQERGDRGGGNRGGGGGDRGGFNRGGDNGGGQRDFGNRGGGNDRGQRNFGNRGGDGGQRFGGAGGDRGGWRERAQAAPQQAQQAQSQQGQRPGWANGGRNDNNNFQGRMRQGGGQDRPDSANRGGDRRFQGRVEQQQSPQFDNRRLGQNGQQPNYRNDPRANRNMNRDFGNRNFGGNDNRNFDNRRFDNNRRGYGGGDNRFYSRNWNQRNDWARYDRRPRTQVNIRIGGFFGGAYPSIASRYYGHNYIWYGSRSWTSWNRPWRIGYVLPPAMYCEPLPYDLYFDLPPPPIGYDYILCDGDILIVGEDSGVVYDAILPW